MYGYSIAQKPDIRPRYTLPTGRLGGFYHKVKILLMGMVGEGGRCQVSGVCCVVLSSGRSPKSKEGKGKKTTDFADCTDL